MMTKLWFRSSLALLTGLALLAGSNFSPAEEKEKDPPRAEKKEDTSKIVENLAAADQMIQFGMENKIPTSVIAGVEAIYTIKTKWFPDQDKVKSETELPDSAKVENKLLAELIDKALAMDAAKDNKTIRAYGQLVQSKLGDKTKGTASGYTRTALHVQAGNPQSITLKFYGGQNMIINVSKTSNVGVPISVTVTNTVSGAVIAPLGTNALSYNYHVAGNQVIPFKITVAIKEGTAPCEVAVTTN